MSKNQDQGTQCLGIIPIFKMGSVVEEALLTGWLSAKGIDDRLDILNAIAVVKPVG